MEEFPRSNFRDEFTRSAMSVPSREVNYLAAPVPFEALDECVGLLPSTEITRSLVGEP